MDLRKAKRIILYNYNFETQKKMDRLALGGGNEYLAVEVYFRSFLYFEYLGNKKNLFETYLLYIAGGWRCYKKFVFKYRRGVNKYKIKIHKELPEKLSKNELFEKIVIYYEKDLLEFLAELMNDSEAEPELSAITCRNEIESLLVYRNCVDSKFPFKKIDDYLLNYLSIEDCLVFWKKVEREIEYRSEFGLL